MTILIISAHEDLHARAIAWALNSIGLKTDIVDVTIFPSHNQLSIYPLGELQNTVQLVACNDGRSLIKLEDVKVVWCRRLVTSAQYFDFSQLHADDLNNATSEVVAFINNLWASVHHATHENVSWINSMAAAAGAKNKALQLKVAQSLGFLVPDTLISNHPGDIRQFCAAHGGEVIMKPFFPMTWKEDGAQYYQPSYLINTAHLSDDRAIQLCPGIFQKHIKKQFELRVVVMGAVMIAAKLDSQQHDHSKVDWRLDAYKGVMRIEPYSLDEILAAKIADFMKRMGLRFGSIDLIVTPENDVFFLEVNEQGQFLFLDEQCPELNIFASMCQFFAAEHGFVCDTVWPRFIDYVHSTDNALLKEQQLLHAQKVSASAIRYGFQACH